MSKETEKTNTWVTNWLESLTTGSSTMSQRMLSSIEHHGGLDAAKALAKEKGVHLLLLEDDKGNKLVAASLKPFEVIC